MEFHVAHAVTHSVVTCPGHQGLVALDTHYPPGDPRQRQGEVAQPTEQIEDLGVGGQPQEVHRPADQRLVDEAVDLDEVSREELHLQVESRQAVDERLNLSLQGSNGVQPPGLQIEPDPVSRLKTAQVRQILRRRRLQHPQHQRRDVVRDCHFDLRQPRADAQTA